MDPNRPDFAALRQKTKYSQSELASAVGVSQATISRIENGESEPSLQLASKLARALDADLKDLIPADILRSLTGELGQDFFAAFCPNPFCDRNAFEEKSGQPVVRWKSGQNYPIQRYDEVNFCTSCGEALVRDCPNCGRKLEAVGTRFCLSCGAKITERPTSQEWQRIRELLKEADADDIPF